MPYPKLNPIRIATFVDTDHAHDIETRHSFTGVFMFLNKNSIHWYSRRQNTVQTSTYRSELPSMRISTELTMAMHYNIGMLGVPIDGTTQTIIDNDNVMNSFSITYTLVPAQDVHFFYTHSHLSVQ